MIRIIFPLTLIVVLSVMTITPTAKAAPAYARQTNMACMACHFQSYPALNAFGRNFKANGYTMMGSQLKIEGVQWLSLPATLNAGVVTKIRYQESNGPKVDGTHNTNNGQLQFPDELILIVGGRVSENIGAQLELNLAAKDAEPTAANFKMPFIYDVSGVKTGAIPFTTADQGVAYGFELLNTGAVRGARIMEARKSFSAQQYIGTATAAEGIALVASNANYFANVSKWSPRSIGAAKSGSPTATYFRLAFTPRVGNWDTGFGLQSWSGSATDPTLADNKTEAYAVDAQAQGVIGERPFGFYLTYANANASAAGNSPNLFNANVNAKTATTAAGQLGVIPDKATLLLALRKGDNGQATQNGDDSVTVGATFQVAQNVQLQLNHEMYSGSAYDGTPANGNKFTTLMLFAAF